MIQINRPKGESRLCGEYGQPGGKTVVPVLWGGYTVPVDEETLLWLKEKAPCPEIFTHGDTDELIQEYQNHLTFNFERGCLTRQLKQQTSSE